MCVSVPEFSLGVFAFCWTFWVSPGSSCLSDYPKKVSDFLTKISKIQKKVSKISDTISDFLTFWTQFLTFWAEFSEFESPDWNFVLVQNFKFSHFFKVAKSLWRQRIILESCAVLEYYNVATCWGFQQKVPRPTVCTTEFVQLGCAWIQVPLLHIVACNAHRPPCSIVQTVEKVLIVLTLNAK